MKLRSLKPTVKADITVLNCIHQKDAYYIVHMERWVAEHGIAPTVHCYLQRFGSPTRKHGCGFILQNMFTGPDHKHFCLQKCFAKQPDKTVSPVSDHVYPECVWGGGGGVVLSYVLGMRLENVLKIRCESKHEAELIQCILFF